MEKPILRSNDEYFRCLLIFCLLAGSNNLLYSTDGRGNDGCLAGHRFEAQSTRPVAYKTGFMFGYGLSEENH